MSAEGQPPLSGDEFRVMRERIDYLLSQMQTRGLDRSGGKAQDLASLHQQVIDVFKEMRDRVEADRQKAQDAINTLVRLQIAQGLAPLFFAERQPYKGHAQLAAMIDDGLLYHGSFIQKPPYLLKFYRQILASLAAAPRSVLEIGVKGGGSTAFWKALFPEASVVGVDIKLRPSLRADPAPDGVVYLQGDQTDEARLRDIAGGYGPFDLVIDDGSHMTGHQATTIRLLLPSVRRGGIYVVEDTHADLEAWDGADTLGGDFWVAFVATVLQKLRRGALPPTAPGVRLARDLAPLIEEVVIARQLLAIRVKERTD